MLLAACLGVCAAGAQGADFEAADAQARALAQKPYTPPAPPSEALGRIDYGQWSQVRFVGTPPWGTAGSFALEPTPPGYLYRDGVALHLTDAQGTRAYPFDAALFDWGGVKLPATLPPATSFSGFRILYRPAAGAPAREVLRFQGSSYFRAVGLEQSEGLAARGLAVNSARPGREEFPRFTAFWLDRPAATDRGLTLTALLDGPSVTGAYAFELRPGRDTTLAVRARLHARRAVENIGIAPLGSMFLQGEASARVFSPLHGEVHDSDGLTIHLADGDWVHRPLRNPPRPFVYSFSTPAPRGFGLCQRDRDPDRYAAPGQGYATRPCAWVAPDASWPPGHVELLELPAASAAQDNIAAAYVVPGLTPGQPLDIAYTLHWRGRDAPAPDLGRVLATHVAQREGRSIYHVDFSAVRGVPGTAPDALIDVGPGARLDSYRVRPNPHTGGVRLEFEVHRDTAEPVQLRAFLTAAGEVLTETWDHVDLPGPD